MGPVCIVTGAGRGIGRAAALALAAAGHPVVVDDTGVGLDGSGPDRAPAQETAALIARAGGTAMATAVDARTRVAAEALVAEAGDWAGLAPTVLVHAAGTLRDAMVHRASDDDWAEVTGSHLGVAVELSRAMCGGMRAEGFGRIVYVGGAAGLVGSVGQASYDVAKAALFGLTRAMALELARYDDAVNYLVPFAFTRMTESIPPVTDQLRRYLAWAPEARPEDVGAVIAWLCSREVGISGQVLGVRGGELALWSQPRPVVVEATAPRWDAAALARALPRLEPHLTPLESEFDIFCTPPMAVPTGPTP